MIYYAHTGGYTELGGIKKFLEKINPIDYKRLVPAVKKLPKKHKIKEIDGSEYLKQIDPNIIHNKDEFSKEAINQIKQIKI